MSNGWIRLHRQVVTNEIFLFDQTAWHIFEYLMLNAEYQTGNISRMSYRTISDTLRLPFSTTVKAIDRLEREQMVTRNVEHNKNKFSICNWAKYQPRGEHSGEQKGEQRGNNGGTNEPSQRTKELKKRKENTAQKKSDAVGTDFLRVQQPTPIPRPLPPPDPEKLARIQAMKDEIVQRLTAKV